MKKILFILVALMAVSSCTNSASINEQKEPRDSTLIGAVTDSIFSQFPEDIDNTAIELDILETATTYTAGFIGKPLPIVEDVPLYYLDAVRHPNRDYCARFKTRAAYKVVDNSASNLSPEYNYEFEVWAVLSKDVIYKLDSNKKYSIRGGRLKSVDTSSMEATTKCGSYEKYLDWGAFLIDHPEIHEVGAISDGEVVKL